MNIWDELRSGKWISNTVAVCAGVVLYLLLTHIGMAGVFLKSVWSIASPLVLGVIIAYLLDPIVKAFERKGFKRKPAVIIMLLLLLLVAGVLLLSMVPQLVSGVVQLMENLSSYIAALEKEIMKIEAASSVDGSGNISVISDRVVKILDNIAGFFDGQAILSTSTNIGSGVVTFIISFILAIYYLMAKQVMLTWTKRFLQKILGDKKYRSFIRFAGRCNRILISYITCSLFEAVIVGIINLLFMAVCGMPYAPLISFVVAITNLAPTFGPIVGCIIGMFILLLVKPKAVILFLIFTLVLQTIDGYILKPKLFGDTLGVSSLLILIFLIMGGRLFGVWGILLAIPTAAILQYLCYEILFPMARKDRKREPRESDSRHIWPASFTHLKWKKQETVNTQEKAAAAEETEEKDLAEAVDEDIFENEQNE